MTEKTCECSGIRQKRVKDSPKPRKRIPRMHNCYVYRSIASHVNVSHHINFILILCCTITKK